MPPFNRSVLTFAQAQAEVAGAAGVATANTEMMTRAGNSLDAVAQRWNRMRWKFLQAETQLGIVGSFTVSGCTTTDGSTTVTTTVPSGFLQVVADDLVSGGGLRPESSVSSTGATSITLYASASATVTGAVLTFRRVSLALPADYKTIFNVRLAGIPKPLVYRPRRLHDRTVIDQTSSSEPYGYDLYLVGRSGKLRILPPPSGADTVILRYYRRMTMPSQTSSAGLDLPEDYEDVFVAAAKVHFLVDKSDRNATQWGYWNQYATEGLKEIRKDERLVEDEDLALQPPVPQYLYGPDSPFYLSEYGG